MRVRALTIRFCLLTLAVIGVTGTLVTAASADPAAFCQNGQWCQDTTMSPLNTPKITARAFINFHRHTSDGSQITIDAIKVDSIGDRCLYDVTISPSLAGQQPWFGSFDCNDEMPVNTAFAKTSVITVEVVDIDSGPDVHHNLTIKDFCSNANFPCKRIPPPS